MFLENYRAHFPLKNTIFYSQRLWDKFRNFFIFSPLFSIFFLCIGEIDEGAKGNGGFLFRRLLVVW